MTVVCASQDGRAEVVANDAGDRVTPAVVGYRDTEKVQCELYLRYPSCHSLCGNSSKSFVLLLDFMINIVFCLSGCHRRIHYRL